MLRSMLNNVNIHQSINRKLYSMAPAFLKEQQINIGSQCINYIKTGNGSHPLLCFPGALGTIWSDFKPQIENLDKNKFTIIAWDPPGYGSSRPPNRKFTSNFYEDDAEVAFELMKAIGIKTFSLLGWSDGGISSIIMAAKYPAAVRNLVIWGSNAYLVQEDLDAMQKVSDLSKWSEKMKAPLLATYGQDLFTDMWNSWLNSIKCIAKERAGDICKDKLSLIQCPTLILHGNKDPMIAPEHPSYLYENIRGAMLHRFPDGKHNIHLRYASEFNELVTQFLEENHKAKI